MCVSFICIFWQLWVSFRIHTSLYRLLLVTRIHTSVYRLLLVTSSWCSIQGSFVGLVSCMSLLYVSFSFKISFSHLLLQRTSLLPNPVNFDYGYFILIFMFVHSDAQQRTATHYNPATESCECYFLLWCVEEECNTALHCIALRCTALHCTALQRTALQRTALHCNALQRTATHCNALQQHAIHCNTLQYSHLRSHAEGTVQARHTATHCNTLQYQHTANPQHIHLRSLEESALHV